MAKRTYPNVTTPRGTFIYPKLVEPDTKYVKPHGEYSTKFALDLEKEETGAFVDRLNEILNAYKAEQSEELGAAKMKKAITADIFDEELDDEGEETGRAIFRFKLKAMVETPNKSWPQQPRLFDAQAQPIDSSSGVDPWTGSEGKVNVEVFPYFMESTKSFGLSLRLKGAQILKLVSGGGASAGDMGFGAEEDGYVAETAASSGFTPDGTDAEDDDDF